MSWSVISAFVLDQLFGYQTANKIRENLITNIAARRGRFLGGSRELPNFAVYDPAALRIRSKYPSLGPHNAENWVDVEIDATELTGLTVQARVEVRGDPVATVTPKIINATDSTDIVVGSACSVGSPDYSGANQIQTLAMTGLLTAGIKKYRLQYTLGANTPVDTWAIGEIEIFATA
jgi:hypothetical protein